MGRTVEPEVVMDDMWGCCPYCHMRQGWKVEVQHSRIWPHPIRCPQCGQTWVDPAEFNVDARRLVKRVMRENPHKIEQMNRTQEGEDWSTFHNDALMERKEKQNRDHRMKFGKDWEPYYNDDAKPLYIRTPGVEYAGRQDDQEADDNAVGVPPRADAQQDNGHATDGEPGTGREDGDDPGV